MSNLGLDYRVKFSLVGDSGVGKSCIMSQLTYQNFLFSHEVTIGVDYGAAILDYEEEGIPRRVKIQIWDTAGQEAFRSICNSYYRGIACIILIYDIGKKETFNNLEYWIQQIRNVNEECIITLVGNKIDNKDTRKVTQEEALQFAKKYDMLYFETSAKTGHNLKNTFISSFKKCQQTPNIQIVDLNNEHHPEKKVNLLDYFKKTFCGCFGR